MKKLVAVMLALTLFLAIGAMTSMAYPAAEAEILPISIFRMTGVFW